MTTTSYALPRLDGRVAVVTGASDGLGAATAEALATAGARVVMACRNQTKGEAARHRLTRPDQASVVRLDLADLTSVGTFADTLDEARVDLLVNNAGVMACPPRRSVDGFELQWATNHLGHFALTGLLMPRLLAAGRAGDGSRARVVTVSSLAAAGGAIDDVEPRSLEGYHRFEAYAASKLANLVFTIELDRRLRVLDHPVDAVAAHPGITHTNLASGIGPALLHLPLKAMSRLMAQPVEAGVGPQLRAATDASLPGGSYVGPDGPRQRRGRPALVDPPRGALDPDRGRQLWASSIEWTGVDPVPLPD